MTTLFIIHNSYFVEPGRPGDGQRVRVEGALAALFLGGAISLYRLKGPKPGAA